ncbi:MAG: VOC family protein [Sphingobium sp.]|nr:VOC family protein [Sphingobium sp.]
MIGYTLFGTNDLDRAKGFYDALFSAIGVGRAWEGPRSVGWGPDWSKPIFGIGTPFDGTPANVGNGTMIALVQPSRAQVDLLHAKVLELGGACEGAPGLRGDEGPQAYYGAYARDLDGNKICFFRVGPADG